MSEASTKPRAIKCKFCGVIKRGHHKPALMKYHPINPATGLHVGYSK